MAKGQMRGNREIRKPKKKKEPVIAAATSTKDRPIPIGNLKTKR